MAKYKRIDFSDGEIMFAIKETPQGVLSVCGSGITLDRLQNIDFFTKEKGYRPTTKKVFDNLFNKAMSNLKELGE